MDQAKTRRPGCFPSRTSAGRACEWLMFDTDKYIKMVKSCFFLSIFDKSKYVHVLYKGFLHAAYFLEEILLYIIF